jgi:hypothetical protein
MGIDAEGEVEAPDEQAARARPPTATAKTGRRGCFMWMVFLCGGGTQEPGSEERL